MSELPPQQSFARKYGLMMVQLVVAVGLMAYVISEIDYHDHVTLPVPAEAGEEQPDTVLVGAVDKARSVSGKVVFITDLEGQTHEIAWKDVRKAADGSVTGIEYGFKSIVLGADPGRIALGFLFLLFGYLVSVVRWWMLLRAQGLIFPIGRVFRWTYIGIFFNNVMLGATGGDVVKAWYVARESKERTRPVVSVFVDRIIGLMSLALLAGIVTTFMLLTAPDPATRKPFLEAAVFIYAILGGAVTGATVYFSRTIRKLVRFDWIVSKLGPLSGIVAEVDKAVLYYRDVWWAVLLAIGLSLCGHGCLVASMMHFGESLGFGSRFIDYYIFCPVVMIIGALPITIQGWGLNETLFQQAFAKVGVPGEMALALSLANRLALMIFSLGGGLCMLFGAPVPDEEPAADADVAGVGENATGAPGDSGTGDGAAAGAEPAGDDEPSSGPGSADGDGEGDGEVASQPALG